MSNESDWPFEDAIRYSTPDTGDRRSVSTPTSIASGYESPDTTYDTIPDSLLDQSLSATQEYSTVLQATVRVIPEEYLTFQQPSHVNMQMPVTSEIAEDFYEPVYDLSNLAGFAAVNSDRSFKHGSGHPTWSRYLESDRDCSSPFANINSEQVTEYESVHQTCQRNTDSHEPDYYNCGAVAAGNSERLTEPDSEYQNCQRNTDSDHYYYNCSATTTGNFEQLLEHESRHQSSYMKLDSDVQGLSQIDFSMIHDDDSSSVSSTFTITNADSD